MKPSGLKFYLSTAAILGILAIGQQVQAATLHNTWTYSIDSFNDGTEGNVIGSQSEFEFYGLAFKETSDRLYFAFNSNLSTNGYALQGVQNGKISYGDLFLNFSNLSSFDQSNGDLYAIRFDATNDTKVEIGLYKDVSYMSVTGQNSGYSRMQDHTEKVSSLGGTASYGDLAATTAYFNSQQAAPTTIASGVSLGAISAFINQSELSDLGLDWGHFSTPGRYTFGFSVDKSLLPSGRFMASLFAECNNDGVVLAGTVEGVPEPSAVAGLVAMLLGLVTVGKQLRRHRQNSVPNSPIADP